MTYLVQSVAALSDVPAAIVSFAVARGWTSGGAGNIVHPTTGQSYTITVSGNALTVTASGFATVAALRLPYLSGTYPGSPVVSLPSQVHLFGNNSPYVAPDSQPYIACVIECGYNQYRHVYIGSLVKAGAYTNGDLFSTNNFYEGQDSFVTNAQFYDDRHRFLFGAYTQNAKDGGGARITHVDNATTWRRFKTLLGNGFLEPEQRMVGNEILGGNADGPNDGLVYRGHADYGAAQVLVPVNLYVSRGNDALDYRLIPVGHASGARLVDMKNLSPGQQVSIGSDDWRVFPEFSKSMTTNVIRSSGAWWPEESSYNFGLAYKE